MNDRIKGAFDQVRAKSELKNKTKDFIFEKTKGYKRRKTVNRKRLAPAFASMIFLTMGGHWFYFTPTVEISIDINPSVELGINRFNRIISVECYNDDGKELTSSLDIKFMDYSGAVSRIMESENIVSLLSKDEVMTVAVIGTGSAQSEEVLSNMQSYTAGKNNAYCCYVRPDEVEKAHRSGLSYGKYKAYLDLQALAPSITVEEIQNMTMREIRDMFNRLSKDRGSGRDHAGGGEGRRKNGNGQSRRNRYNTGQEEDFSAPL